MGSAYVPDPACREPEQRSTGACTGQPTHSVSVKGQTASVSGHEPWTGWESEDVARWWQSGFTEGADPEYQEQIIPMAVECLTGARRILDVGCGEGQIARVARAIDGVESVVGIDPTRAQLDVARERGEGLPTPGRRQLRFRSADASFDAAVACLVFEHIHAFDVAIAEVARVLEPGGRFAFFLNHPLLQTPNSG